MKRPRAPLPNVPGDLVALETDDGELAVLSFTLPGNDAINLSLAESDVARHILAGRSNSEIAALRRCSTRTVANQVASLFRKLGVRSRLELVALAPLLGPCRGPADAAGRTRRT
jgi:DNA-binding CsgD family transcriptional regulator